jgi:predicted ATP-grasp superfamily ATP-dependent carboligase
MKTNTTNEQPACPVKPMITIQFQDADDLKQFQRYMRMAKAQAGTVTGLYAGLLCSALKRAEVLP